MRYRLLGGSGLRVSEIALGTMTFSDRDLTWGASPQQSRAIFEVFADAGGTFIDTASIYGDVFGGEDHSSERVLAELLSADREHFVVATKYTSSNTADVCRSGNSFKTMRASVEASLRALRTDHVDLLWLHMWDGTTPVDEVLRGAQQLVTAGKILYLGFSDTPAWVVSNAVAMARAHGWAPPIAVQVEYSLVERTAERELLPMAEALELGVAAWGPLAGGVLTGKYTRCNGRGGRYGDMAFAGRVGPVGEQRLAVARAVDAIAAELGCPPSHVAMAWLRQRPGPVIPIVGARSPDQLIENLAGLELVLTDEHLRDLEAASAPTLGFPQALLAHGLARSFMTSGHFDEIENHRALHYPVDPTDVAGHA